MVRSRLIRTLAATLLLCSATVSAQQDRASISEKGSVFIVPKVELRWNAAGDLIQDTFIHLANDRSDSVRVLCYWVNGDPPIAGEPGWNRVDWRMTLTANQPSSWSASGEGANVPPMSILDPGLPPGRPDPDGSSDRVLRGYLVGWAVNNDDEQIRHDHLHAHAVVVNYADDTAYGFNATHVQAVVGATGEAIGTPGLIEFGAEYAPVAESLVFNFAARGTNAYPVSPAGVSLDGDLTILPALIDLRQNGTPQSALVDFEMWNENEVKFTGWSYCFSCWLEAEYANIGSFAFDGAFLQTDAGYARITSIGGSTVCGGTSVAMPLIGIARRAITFNGSGSRADAAIEMAGIGSRSGSIAYDPTGPPPPNQAAGPRRPATTASVHPAGAPAAPGSLPPRVDMGQPGSAVMIPNVEVRWDLAGNLVQDTFIHLANIADEPVRVHVYLTNGDAPLEENGGERAHRGHNVLVGDVQLTANQPLFWSALNGSPSAYDAIDPMTSLDPGVPDGRPTSDVGGDERVLRGSLLIVAVDDNGAPISWNDLLADAIMVNEPRATAWACPAHHFSALGAHGQPIGDGWLEFDGVMYAFAADQLAAIFPAADTSVYTLPGIVPVQAFATNRVQALNRSLSPDASSATMRTKLDYLVWNQNEVQLSGAFRCIDDFDATPFVDYGVPNHFVLNNLQTDFGRFRLDGIESVLCHADNPSHFTPLLAVMETRLILNFDHHASAGHGSIGLGLEAAFIELACINPARCQDPDQLPHGSSALVLVTSDTASGFAAADNFTPVASGTVTNLCWWGAYVDFGPLVDCGPGTGDAFAVTYFLDDAGIPGAVHAGPFEVAAPSDATGNFIGTGIGPIAEYRYSASHPAVPVSAGSCYWVEIRNSSSGTCWWLQSTAEGDGVAAQDDEGNGYDAGDVADWGLAFCLNVGLGDPADCNVPCFGDLDDSGDVGFNDLVTLLASWGPCPGCPADLDGNDDVGFNDLVALLAAWGPCPG